MDEQFSGEMIVGLLRMVERNTPRPAVQFRVAPELDQLRDALLKSPNPSPLKAALLTVIDRMKSESPSQAEVLSALADVKRLWPQGIGKGSKAVGVDLL